MLRIRELRIQGVVFLFLLIALASIRIFLSSSYFDLHPNPNKKVIIAFRNDDIQEFSGTKLEIDLFNLFKKSHIPQTYATVPFKTDLINNKGLITILKEHLRLGLAEIALHGYSHQNLGGGMKSEFMGMPYKEQCEKITEGKNYLEELFHTKIFTFVPPFNAYDLNTTEACYKNGIIVLSSSNFFPVQNNHKITIVNYNFLLTDAINKLDIATKNGAPLSIFIVYYHSFMGNIYKNDDYCGRISKLLNYIKSTNNIDVMTLGNVGIRYPEYFRARYFLDTWKSKTDILLAFLRHFDLKQKLNYLFYCGERSLGLFIILSLFYIYGVIFIIGYTTAIIFIFASTNKKILKWLSVSSVLLWIILVVPVSIGKEIGVLDVGLLILVLGFVSNTILYHLKN